MAQWMKCFLYVHEVLIPSTAEMLSGHGSLPLIPELGRLGQRLSEASWLALLASTVKL